MLAIKFICVRYSQSVPRSIAVLTLCLLSSCALAFQEHESGGYTPHHEPRCTTVPGWRLLDLGMTALEAGSAITADRDGQSKVVVGLALVPILFHIGSWASGRAWAADCERARRNYDDERLPEISSRPAPPPETTQRPPPQPQEAPPQSRHGWCFDAGGGAVTCYDTRETCQAELEERAPAVHGDCQEQ